MPRVQTNTTNFSAGEFAPELEGRSDIDKFNSSAQLLQNVVVLKQGGFTHRPPLEFLGIAASIPAQGRILAFVYSVTDAYILEFGNLTMRVWRGGVLVESSPGVPYVLTTPFTTTEIQLVDFTQGADSVILTSGLRPAQRLRRFANAQWAIDDAPFSPAPVSEIGERINNPLTISATTVGSGRTVTATGTATFMASDVGRTLAWDTGLAVITGFTSATVVTAQVTQGFTSPTVAGNGWVLGLSPMTALTPSGTAPGASILLTLAADGWRTSYIGSTRSSYIQINGGLVKITGASSATVIQGTVMQELSSATAAPADSWALLVEIWNQFDGYPKTCTFHQQRLWFANTAKYPQSLWGSSTGLFFDFTPGVLDDSAVYKSASSDQINPIQFLSSKKTILMLGYGAEFEGQGGVEKPITQTNMQINAESEYGSAFVKPQKVGKDVIFIERGGTTMRALYPGQVEGYDTADISIYSEHLLREGVKSMSFEKRPGSIIWVATVTGKLHAFTYNKEQNTLAWASGFTDGAVEWLASVPEGVADATYALVRRTVNGATVRYIERLSWDINRGKFDSVVRRSLPNSEVGANWNAAHLEGKQVGCVADGVYVGLFTVTGGIITLPRTANSVFIGLPIEAKAVLRAPEVGTGTGTSQGQAQSTNRVWVRLLRTVGLLVNGEEITFRKFGNNLLDKQVDEFTGLKDVTTTGWADGESPLTLVQNQGMPWTVLSVIRSFTTNAG